MVNIFKILIALILTMFSLLSSLYTSIKVDTYLNKNFKYTGIVKYIPIIIFVILSMIITHFIILIIKFI